MSVFLFVYAQKILQHHYIFATVAIRRSMLQYAVNYQIHLCQYGKAKLDLFSVVPVAQSGAFVLL